MKPRGHLAIPAALGLLGLAAALLCAGPVRAEYVLEGLGPIGGLSAEAVGINDAGQVAGTRLGT